MTEVPRLRVGLVGYGLAGRVFHAALYPAVPEIELVAVASGDAAKVHRDHPNVTVHATARALFADDAVELVVLATPSPTHADLAVRALEAGRHVLTDKPFAPSVADADRIVAAATRVDRVASCFQNRRFDADFLTLRRLIEGGELGDVHRFEARYDRWAPAVRTRWQEEAAPGTGLHHDLGSHLVDQALVLFGAPDAVQGDLQVQREGSTIVDAFHARLLYDDGRRAELSASLLVPDHLPRYRVHGTRASWSKSHVDPQEEQLRHAGLPVTDAARGVEADAHHGTLITTDGASRRTPSERGDWPRLYAQLARAIRDGTEPPVTMHQARDTVRTIAALEASARGGCRIRLDEAPSPTGTMT